MTQWLKAVAVLQTMWISFSVYTWQPTAISISSFMENNSLFCPLWEIYTHSTHRLIHII